MKDRKKRVREGKCETDRESLKKQRKVEKERKIRGTRVISLLPQRIKRLNYQKAL